MIGRLTCGDDCLAQIFKNKKPTNKFRYQIKAKNYDEGIKWGKICAFKVFNTTNFYSYKSNGLLNTIIKLKKKDVAFLLKNRFILLRKDFKKFKDNTALALLKNVPHKLILNFNDTQIGEFLAGIFDSDGTIRPSTEEMFVSLDSQLQTREEPLAYEQIRLFKSLAKMNKVPRILRIEVVHPPKEINKAMKFFMKAKRIFPRVKIKKDNNSKGTKIYLFLSCNFQDELNRRSWKFWFKEVVPRLIREDKRHKFLEIYKKRLNLLKLNGISLRSPKHTGKELAHLINSRGRVLIKRPSNLQCEIRIKFSNELNIVTKIKDTIEKFLHCKVSSLRRKNSYIVSFYISSKNYLKVHEFIFPFLERGDNKKRIADFLRFLFSKFSV